MDEKTLMDDSELIARCRAGEASAFEALVNRYQAPLLTMAWSLLGNREDALDAAQQAFAAAFCKLDAFDPGRSFKNWLFAIAWKDCLDMKRRQKTAQKNLRRLAGEIVLATDPDPGDPSRLEDSSVFGPLLAKLKPRERVALSLRMNEECTAAEIADVLGCTESSARVYVFNAIRRIRGLWKKG
jgi:RNA polymerase sigma-70 factor (ECF subfamily)